MATKLFDNAKKNKADEFYTQLSDIEKELIIKRSATSLFISPPANGIRRVFNGIIIYSNHLRILMNRNILTINRKQFITVPLLPHLFEYKLFFLQSKHALH